jgi:hypothetical protein
MGSYATKSKQVTWLGLRAISINAHGHIEGILRNAIPRTSPPAQKDA